MSNINRPGMNIWQPLPPESLEKMWMTCFLEQLPGTTLRQVKKRPKPTLPKKLKALKPYFDELNKKPTKLADATKSISNSSNSKDKEFAQMKGENLGEDFISDDLEAIFAIQFRQDQAAKRIQKFWLFLKLIRQLYYTCRAIRAIILLQKNTRGFLCRKNIPVTIKQQIQGVSQIQSIVRRYQSNRRWRFQLHIERKAAVRIQRFVREVLERVRLKPIYLYTQATKIQRQWRRFVHWKQERMNVLHKHAAKIQSVMRRCLAKERVNQLREKYNKAACAIQAACLTWISHCSLSNRLIAREKGYRNSLITSLTSEEIQLNEKLTKLSTRFVTSGIREQKQQLEQHLQQQAQIIQEHTNNWQEFRRQHDILTPMAIQQGWKTEIQKNIELTYQEIMALKTQFLFQEYQQYATCNEDIVDFSSALLEFVDNTNKIKDWRCQEVVDREEWMFTRDIEELQKKKRQEIGDEKRKWKITFHALNGKPDKSRKNRRKADINATTTTTTATGTKEPFFQKLNNKLMETKNSIDNNSNINKLQQFTNKINNEVAQNIDNIELQTFQNQASLFSEILQPITSIIENTMSGATTTTTTTKGKKESNGFSGYKELGSDYCDVMTNINNINKDDTHPLQRNSALAVPKIPRKKLGFIPTPVVEKMTAIQTLATTTTKWNNHHHRKHKQKQKHMELLEHEDNINNINNFTPFADNNNNNNNNNNSGNGNGNKSSKQTTTTTKTTPHLISSSIAQKAAPEIFDLAERSVDSNDIEQMLYDDKQLTLYSLSKTPRGTTTTKSKAKAKTGTELATVSGKGRQRINWQHVKVMGVVEESVVPWDMLDTLDADKHRFEHEVHIMEQKLGMKPEHK